MLRKLIYFPAAIMLLLGCRGGPQPRVPFPEGYRNWIHVRTSVARIEPGDPLYRFHAGYRHVYVNAEGLASNRRRGNYPDGAILVLDSLDATALDGALYEGVRRMVNTMHKDALKYPATGGWGFEAFEANSRRPAESDFGKTCLKYHQKERYFDYVFGALRL